MREGDGVDVVGVREVERHHAADERVARADVDGQLRPVGEGNLGRVDPGVEAGGGPFPGEVDGLLDVAALLEGPDLADRTWRDPVGLDGVRGEPAAVVAQHLLERE